MQPNCAGKYSIQNGKIEIQRYYPFDKIEETKTEEEYQETIKELGRIMSNTMQCIANKWPDKKVSIRSMLSIDGQYNWLEERALVISTADNCRRPYTVDLGGKFYTVSRQRFAGEKESSIVFTQWKPHPDDEKAIKEKTEKKISAASGCFGAYITHKSEKYSVNTNIYTFFCKVKNG